MLSHAFLVELVRTRGKLGPGGSKPLSTVTAAPGQECRQLDCTPRVSNKRIFLYQCRKAASGTYTLEACKA